MKITITKSEKLIKALIHNIQGMSFSSAQKSIRTGKIKVNNNKVKDNINLNIGDIVEVYEFKQSKPQIPVIYEDENIIIVNKPYGIECATRDKSSENTYSLEELFIDKNAIVVHRLDRLTEGIVILARNKEIAVKFERYFRLRLIDKFYTTCVYGRFSKEGIQTAYLRKNNRTALVEISDNEEEDYKKIITEFKLTDTIKDYSILDIKLHTGRTHQIRAHLSHLGTPVIGDSKYGNKNSIDNSLIKVLNSNKYNGYCLTAYKVKFNLDDDLKYLNDLNIEIKPTWNNIIFNNIDKL